MIQQQPKQQIVRNEPTPKKANNIPSMRKTFGIPKKTILDVYNLVPCDLIKKTLNIFVLENCSFSITPVGSWPEYCDCYQNNEYFYFSSSYDHIKSFIVKQSLSLCHYICLYGKLADLNLLFIGYHHTEIT